MARFYLDENFDFKVVGPLSHLGHTVIIPDDLGARRCWDDEQFFIAVQQQAILVTFNAKDFRLLHAAWYSWSRHWDLNKLHYGVVILRQTAPPWSSEALAQELHNVIARFDLINRVVEWRPSTGWAYVTPYRLLPEPEGTADA